MKSRWNVGNRVLGNPVRIVVMTSGIAIGVFLAAGSVFAATHRQNVAEAPGVLQANFSVGGTPTDGIDLSYVPNGFKRSEDLVQKYDSGAEMHSQHFAGDASGFEIEAIRRPEPLDRGADLMFPTDVRQVSLEGREVLVLTASDGSGDVAVIEWQNGPAIVKVIGNHMPVDELMKIAAGGSISSANA